MKTEVWHDGKVTPCRYYLERGNHDWKVFAVAQVTPCCGPTQHVSRICTDCGRHEIARTAQSPAQETGT